MQLHAQVYVDTLWFWLFEFDYNLSESKIQLYGLSHFLMKDHMYMHVQSIGSNEM